MKAYWLAISGIVLVSTLSVFIYNALLKRSKSIAYQFVLKVAVIWVCALLPLWGINVLYQRYHAELFFGARGISVAAVMITAFITHIVLLSRQK